MSVSVCVCVCPLGRQIDQLCAVLQLLYLRTITTSATTLLLGDGSSRGGYSSKLVSVASCWTRRRFNWLAYLAHARLWLPPLGRLVCFYSVARR